MHLKNFSLIESAAGSREYSLSAAYDMLPVNIVLLEDKEEMALTLNGKKRRLKKRDFMSFASKCGIAENAAEKMLSKMCSLEDKLLCACEDSPNFVCKGVLTERTTAIKPSSYFVNHE